MRRLAVVLVLVAAALAVSPALPAWACSPPRPGSPLPAADLVFVGVATHVGEPEPGGDDVVLRFAVESVETGRAGDQVELTTPPDSAACGYTAVVGHRYRIRAQSGATYVGNGNAHLGAAETPQDDRRRAAWWWGVPALTVGIGLWWLRRRYGRAS